jgi:hypothetical protein
VILLMVAPTLTVAAMTTDQTFRAQFREPRSLTAHTVLLYLCAAVIFLLGSSLPLLRHEGSLRRRRPDLLDDQLGTLRAASSVLYRLTIFGYIAFLAVAIQRGLRPAVVIKAFSKGGTESNTLREVFAPVTGVTTLTQVGIAFVVVSVLVLLRRRDRTTLRRLLIVLALALARAYLVNERLALLELVVPALVLVAFDRAAVAQGVRRVLVQLAPLVLVPVLVLVFSVFEYSRSYNFYATTAHESFLGFGVNRLAGYYITAYNNGQISLDHQRYPGRLPYDTLEVLWTAPGVSQLHAYAALAGRDDVQFSNELLKQYGNPEFNSPGGLATPLVDYGVIGGLLFLFVLGVAVGLVYRDCCDGRTYAILLYPPLVTGLFELPRYIYWTQGRLAVALVALAIVAGRVVKAHEASAASLRPRSRSSGGI